MNSIGKGYEKHVIESGKEGFHMETDSGMQGTVFDAPAPCHMVYPVPVYAHVRYYDSV